MQRRIVLWSRSFERKAKQQPVSHWIYVYKRTHAPFQLELKWTSLFIAFTLHSLLLFTSYASFRSFLHIWIVSPPFAHRFAFESGARVAFGFECINPTNSRYHWHTNVHIQSALITVDHVCTYGASCMFSNRLDKVNCKLISSIVYSNPWQCNRPVWENGFVISARWRGNFLNVHWNEYGPTRGETTMENWRMKGEKEEEAELVAVVGSVKFTPINASIDRIV